jgi:hypothetical protein
LVEETPERDGIAVTLLDCSVESLAGWVLSFGSKAEVLEPERLKELVAAEAVSVAAAYGQPDRRIPSFSAPDGSMATGRPARNALNFSKVS